MTRGMSFLMDRKRLRRFLLRYYPPGVALDYENADGSSSQVSVDLLDLEESTNVEVVANDVACEHDLTDKQRSQLCKLLKHLIRKQRPARGTFGSLLQFKPHTSPVCNAACTKTGDRLATVGYDGTCRVWNTSGSGGLLQHTLKGHAGIVSSVAFNLPFGSVIATGGFDREARLWDASKGTEQAALRGHEGEVVTLAFSPDGARLATASMDATVRLWDVATGACQQVLRSHTEPVSCVAFSRDSRTLLTAGCDKMAFTWDARAPAAVGRLGTHSDEVACASFSYDGTRALTGDAEGVVRVWDMASRRAAVTMVNHRRRGGEVTAAKFDSSDRLVVSAGSDSSVYVTSVLTGEVRHELAGHKGAVAAIAISARGNHVATGGADGTCMLWDIATSRCLQTLRNHTDEVFGLNFNYDGSKLFTTSVDGTCVVWNRRRKPRPAGKP